MSPTLLLVTPYFPPEGGGLERYAHEIAHRLASRHGWRVVVATSGPARRGVTREQDGPIVVHRLGHQLRLSNTRVGIGWPRALSQIIDAERPDLVNAHAPVPGLADLARFAHRGTPFVVTYHAGTMHKGRPGPDLLVDGYERSLGRGLIDRADWVISSSAFVRDTYLARVRAKTTTIEPGVDTGLFRPADQRRVDRLVFVGSLQRSQEHKGLASVLAALATVPDTGATLDVIGGGDGLAGFRARAARLGLGGRVRFLGHLGTAGVAEALRETGIFVLPTRNDSFPMSLLEAMATGLPVVTTRVGGIPELVSDEVTGCLVDPDDTATFRRRVSTLLADPERAGRMGSAARRRVEARSSWIGQAQATHAVFDAIREGRPPDGRTRIAVVVPHYHPKVGGLESYSHQLATRLQRSGRYEVTVWTSNHESRASTISVNHDVTVFRYPTWMRLSNTPVSPTWALRLRHSLAANRIALVNAHTPVPFMAESAAVASGRRPFVMTYHAGSMMKNRRGADALIRLYEQRLLPALIRRADRIVAVSPFVRDRFLRGLAVDAELIPPGVDPSRFRPAPVSPHPPTITYVGRIERSSSWKGIDVLIDAFALIAPARPDVRLVLVGDGDAVDDHRRTVDRLGLGARVRFTGAVSGDELTAHYQRATVVVLPSVSEAESFGMTLIEAMACGRPVIGSRVGGIPSVIDDGVDGVLVAPGDARALAAACSAIVADPARATALGQRGLAKVRAAYSWDRQIDAYDHLFQELVGDPAPAPTGSAGGVRRHG
jgi:glycosyltransferase involved in cell wall biosynthesis